MKKDFEQTPSPQIHVLEKILDREQIGSEEIIKIVLFCEECEPHLTKANQKEYFAKLEHQYKHISKAIQLCLDLGTSDEFLCYGLRIIGTSSSFIFYIESNTICRFHIQILVCYWETKRGV